MLVVDLEGLEEMEASKINAIRLNAKEVILPPKGGENYKFTVADGTGRRPSTENIDLDPESTNSRRKSPKFPRRIRRVFHQPRNFKTHFRMPVKHEMISGPSRETSKNRHHVEPRVKLCTPREESFPIPLKY